MLIVVDIYNVCHLSCVMCHATDVCELVAARLTFNPTKRVDVRNTLTLPCAGANAA